jgi:hypothetical protein
MTTREMLTGTVYQGTTYPIPVTILAAEDAPLDDLSTATITIEPYRGDGSAASGTWTWTTDTAAINPGDPIVGHISPPTDGSGFPSAREVVRILVVVNIPAEEPFEVGHVALTVKSRNGIG